MTLRSQFVASKIVEYYGWPGLHLREREQFLPEVFYGGPDMIKCIVDDQEPVMDIRCCAHIYRCVLVVVPFYVKTQVIVNSLGVYCSEHTSAAFIQQCQDCFVNIIVNKNDAFAGASYEVADKNVCVEYLPVEKDALAWRQLCFKEEVNLA